MPGLRKARAPEFAAKRLRIQVRVQISRRFISVCSAGSFTSLMEAARCRNGGRGMGSFFCSPVRVSCGVVVSAEAADKGSKRILRHGGARAEHKWGAGGGMPADTCCAVLESVRTAWFANRDSSTSIAFSCQWMIRVAVQKSKQCCVQARYMCGCSLTGANGNAAQSPLTAALLCTAVTAATAALLSMPEYLARSQLPRCCCCYPLDCHCSPMPCSSPLPLRSSMCQFAPCSSMPP